ncbi:Seven TM Receptor [Caenorhabditis elegans]|uniref:Seven TM Receptor n=1 Tax=Caenorhabditis elegans TaxID=6239 RepID=V5Z1T3_CAEEL|nr:Seven TM Receptor [Caenorhabditis elegans]pir/T34166/ hypothetical protein C42D4.12 - Caenorhabditis elegans [Caenorhabditis elegans]CCD66625.2 Seven TM Receptor [Caenorhabditis elegans]|eukprot:NP_001294211.1 Seven TM Receptor [Caenorhabditis elegans]
MHAYHTIIQRCTAGFGILINAFLIFLILTKSPKKLGTYKYLMIYIALFELIYAILDMLTVPEIFSIDSAFFVIIKSDKTIIPQPLTFSATVTFSSMFGTSIAIFAIHFIYRYATVTSHTLMSAFQSWKIFIWLSFPIVFGIVWSAGINLALAPNKAGDQFFFFRFVYCQKVTITQFLTLIVLNEYLFKTGHTIDQVYYIGPYFYPESVAGVDYFNWKPFIGIGCMLLANFVSTLVILYIGIKSYNYMKSVLPSSSQSAQFKSLQSQLFYALILQTIIPVILMHTPAFFIFIATFFNSSFELLGQIPAMSIVFYPSIDPLPNIFVIWNYKAATIDYFNTVKRWILKMTLEKTGLRTQNTTTCAIVRFDHRSSLNAS